MKFIKIFSQLMFVMMLSAVSAAAVTLDTDTFQTDLEGWSGNNVTRLASSKVMSIPNQGTATKTFSYSSYANQAVTLSFDAVKYNFESTDTIIVTINGRTVYNSNTAGTITLNGWLDSNGNMVVTIKSNSNDAAEYITVDNVALNTGATYTVDNLRDFALINSYNIYGNMQIIGNSVMVDTGGACPNASTNNNDLNPVWADKDNNASTWNSTSANITLPAGVSSTKIKYAGLYWQGRVGSGEDFSTGNTVLFKPQGFSQYQSVTSQVDKFNWSIRTQDRSYQGVADVTNLVKQSIDTVSAATIASTGFSGTFWAANVLAKEMSNGFGAWSLVVIYEDPNDTLKNISVYDGYKEVTGNTEVPVTLSGFLTPNTPPVNSKFLLFGGEGDISLNDSTTLSNASGTDVALGSNIFNSSETDSNGTNITSRDPSCQNTIGIDIHTYEIGTNGSPSIIGTGQTSTTVKLKSAASNGDTYYPGVFAFSTDIYQPQLCYIENIFRGTTNISGQGVQVNRDENLTVRVYIKNTGNEAADGVQIIHQFDSKFPYAVNSANYNNSNPSYETVIPPTTYTRISATDGSGDDLYEYNTTSLKSKINLGINATATSGGNFQTTSSSTPTYAVFEYTGTVKATDSNYTNVYQAGYKNTVLGVDYTNTPVTIHSCDGTTNSFWGFYPIGLTANVDVVDGYSGSGGTYASWINTKVSKKGPYTLNAVYLGTSTSNPIPQNYTPSGNLQQAASLTILFKLADMSNGDTCQNAPTVPLFTTLGGNTPVVATINAGYTSATSNAFIMGYVNSGTTPLSKKDVRIKYKAVDFNQLILDSGIQCAQRSSTGGVVEGIPACLIAQPNDNTENQNKAIQNYITIFGQNAYNQCYTANGQPCAASNGGVGAAPYDTIYGCFECSIGAMPYSCSKDNFAIRPEKLDIQSTHVDMPNLLRAAQDYNTTIHAYDYATTTNSADYNVTSANGVYTIVTTKYNRNDVPTPSMEGNLTFSAGDFNMTNGISTRSGIGSNEVAGLKFDDVGKININLQDQQWAAVDTANAADTTPRDCSANGAYVCSDKNVTYIPHHFDFKDLNITNNNGSPGTFTYLANEVNQMAARIVTTMRSLNKDGNVTKNFATFPLWENTVTVTPVVRKNTYLYPDANETVINNLAIGFTAGTKTIQWNEHNASQYLRFNFQRDYNPTTPPSPFDVNGSELNISMSSSYTDPATGHIADITGSRDQNASGLSTFVYGRIIPRDVRVFGLVSYDANGWYEVYNASTLSGNQLMPSRNAPSWFINRLHSDVAGDAFGGDANVTRLQTSPTASTGVNIGGTAINGVETYHFAAPLAIPYSAKAHIDTDPWLWYSINGLPYADPSAANLECLTHPCFNINVVPAVGATGSAKQDAEAVKANKASSSSGGWKSTSDYAPAVR